MPELPDLEYIISVLSRALPGHRIQHVRVKNPIVLRMGVVGTLEDMCQGKAFGACWRHRHYLVLPLGKEHEITVNPMLAGRFRLADVAENDERSLCVAFQMEEGKELRYLDEKQMGKVYLVPAGDRSIVPGYDAVGVEPLSPAFTLEALQNLLIGRRDQVRAFLLDKRAVAATPPSRGGARSYGPRGCIPRSDVSGSPTRTSAGSMSRSARSSVRRSQRSSGEASPSRSRSGTS